MTSANKTSSALHDPFQVWDTFETGHGVAHLVRLDRLARAGFEGIDRLPFSLRILLEAALRNCDGFVVTDDHVKAIAQWDPAATARDEIPFHVARVVMQDFTGVPAVVDLAAMRSAMQRLGGNPRRVNPLIPVDLVIDHSVQVDYFGSLDALSRNVEIEFQRNRERYEFLRWGQKAFDNFRCVPPNVGIVHQVNLEFLAKGVFLRPGPKGQVAIPDSLVGTDSHTTMINGLGVVGWGVGGIEAEACMLGQPLYMLLPDVVGFELSGELAPGVTATDLVLTVTQILREAGVVDKFVEFFGPGVSRMSLADRATIANMAPEYGATMGFFPVDAETLNYLRRTGRSEAEVGLVERYYKEQGLFRTDETPAPRFSRQLALNLGTVEASLAGPKRPQDRIPLTAMKSQWNRALRASVAERGFALDDTAIQRQGTVKNNGRSATITHGSVVIAAITSCTNTSNPSVMVAAGLLAKNAVSKGLKVPPFVKTSLAPGSRVVTDYLDRAGLSEPLKQLGFDTVGYGCTTCIGNSGPLPDAVASAVTAADLVAVSVLSGNRNFEGRVHPQVKANFLASPPLVVAYALAGTTDIDLVREPLGKDPDGKPVYLHDLWPSHEQISRTVAEAVQPEMFTTRYAGAFESNPTWNAIQVPEGDLYRWDATSTYIQEPPFLAHTTRDIPALQPLAGARCLAVLGDSVTTDHISPAGNIAQASPAGKYLQQHGVAVADFNSYGARRGNDRIMVRGTFANIRIRNFLTPGVERGVTRCLLAGQDSTAVVPIYDAAMAYQAANVPTIILAGAEYGTGSSRDWAAKGASLLGVRAVIAQSFERIHRSNLVNMGVLPLQFQSGQTWGSLGLTGEESFEILGLDESLRPRSQLTVQATHADGTRKIFSAQVRIDTPVELEYYRNGGILQTVLRRLITN